MMLGVSGLMGSSGDGAAAADALEGGGASGGSSEVGASSSIPGGSLEDSERSGGGGGNRWPRQETLALLKIRSDMDVAFRDSSLKGPLWDEVSRKMAELGFHRSAKKCKEKFENVYKYHKRTKDGRASKPDGKTYRFFDQLQALETSPPLPFTPPPPRTQPPATTTMTAPPPTAANFPMPSHVTTVPSISPNPLSMLPPNTSIQTSHNPINNIIPPFQPSMNASNLPQAHPFQSSHDHHILKSLLSDSSSSSTSSDEDIQRRRGKKRKWKDFFERLMKEVVQKQEELQKKFLETLEKRERDRMAREEAWRIQETARMNRDHDLLVQERSIAAAKDAAVIAFLQKVSEQHNLQIPNITSNITVATQAVHPQPPPRQPAPPQPPPPPPPPPPPQQSPLPLPLPLPLSLPTEPPALPVVTVASTTKISKKDNGGSEGFTPTTSSRWPKTEIEALIKLRTNLDLKYQENGPKGPLWEEISAGMRKMGYNRSSKRCKEKWENINKYYKKVKESSKKRPEDSKTCPYFHQLEALHREKNKNDNSSLNLEYATAKQENPMVPIMARPEQQWPNNPHRDSTMHDQDQDNDSENNEDDDDVDDEDEEDAGGYEIVTNKQPSSMTNATELMK